MANLFVLLWVLFQPSFPDLPTPTPWQAPTSAPTIEVLIEDADELVATAQADQYSFEVEGDQVYFNNQAILPNLESQNSVLLFSYFKWTVGSGVQSVLGPFAPLMISLGILITLGFISLLVYFWENVIVTVLKLVGFIINSILRIFGR